MKKRSHLRSAFLLGAAAVFVLAGLTVRAQEVGYDGQFTLSPNGDLDIVLKLTLPMERYQYMRDSVSNLYLFMRGLASSRADVEVAQKKAEWDDASRTVTFTIRQLGAARNMGNHWEADIEPGAVFSNLDEAKRTLYFNENGTNEMGNVRGNFRVQLPASATQAKYDASRKLVTYVLPVPSSGSLKKTLLVPAAILLVLGLGGIGASFIVGRKPSLGPLK
jgi:hypothetical protein